MNIPHLHRTRSATKAALAMSSARIAKLLPLEIKAVDVLRVMVEFHKFIAAADTETTRHWKSDRDVWLDFRIAQKKGTLHGRSHQA